MLTDGGTPEEVTFVQVYGGDTAEEKTEAEAVGTKDIPPLLPYLLGGVVLGVFIRHLDKNI